MGVPAFPLCPVISMCYRRGCKPARAEFTPHVRVSFLPAVSGDGLHGRLGGPAAVPCLDVDQDLLDVPVASNRHDLRRIAAESASLRQIALRDPCEEKPFSPFPKPSRRPAFLTQSPIQLPKPAALKTGRPRSWSMREIVSAIFHVLRGGIAWRLMPSDFPPRPTVCRWFAAFRDGSVFEEVSSSRIRPVVAAFARRVNDERTNPLPLEGEHSMAGRHGQPGGTGRKLPSARPVARSHPAGQPIQARRMARQPANAVAAVTGQPARGKSTKR